MDEATQRAVKTQWVAWKNEALSRDPPSLRRAASALRVYLRRRDIPLDRRHWLALKLFVFMGVLQERNPPVLPEGYVARAFHEDLPGWANPLSARWQRLVEGPPDTWYCWIVKLHGRWWNVHATLLSGEWPTWFVPEVGNPIFAGFFRTLSDLREGVAQGGEAAGELQRRAQEATSEMRSA